MAPTKLPSHIYFTYSDDDEAGAAIAASDVDEVIAVPDSDSDVDEVVAVSSDEDEDDADFFFGCGEVTAVYPDGTERRIKRKREYWHCTDEYELLRTIARLRRVNLGGEPPASMIYRALESVGLSRKGLVVGDVADKRCKLKLKFRKALSRGTPYGGKRRRRNSRNKTLFEYCKEAWPELLREHRRCRLARRSRARIADMYFLPPFRYNCRRFRQSYNCRRFSQNFV